jgi:hypothetical protein
MYVYLLLIWSFRLWDPDEQGKLDSSGAGKDLSAGSSLTEYSLSSFALLLSLWNGIHHFYFDS